MDGMGTCTFLELILHVGTPFRRSEYERSSTIHVNDLPGHVPDTCDADQEIAIISCYQPRVRGLHIFTNSVALPTSLLRS